MPKWGAGATGWWVSLLSQILQAPNNFFFLKTEFGNKWLKEETINEFQYSKFSTILSQLP